MLFKVSQNAHIRESYPKIDRSSCDECLWTSRLWKNALPRYAPVFFPDGSLRFVYAWKLGLEPRLRSRISTRPLLSDTSSIAWRRPLPSENSARILPRWWSDKPIRYFLLRFPTQVTMLLLSVGPPLSLVLGSGAWDPIINYMHCSKGPFKHLGGC